MNRKYILSFLGILVFLVIACTGLSTAAVEVDYEFSPMTLMVNTSAPSFDLEIANSSNYEFDKIVTTSVEISVAPDGSNDYVSLGTFSDTDPELNPYDTLVLKFALEDLYSREVNGKAFDVYLLEDICDDNRFGYVSFKIEGDYGNGDRFEGYESVQVIQNKKLPNTGGPKK